MRRLKSLSGVDTDGRIAELKFPGLNEFGFDVFGLNPEALRRVAPLIALLYKRYFRVEVRGIEKIPPGRCILIANHSGQVPVDGFMIAASVLIEGRPPRLARAMVEKVIPTIPFMSVALPRIGQVVGTRENGRILLENDELILVFPEGSRGISKTWGERYQLKEFGQGFMRLAMETGAPIVPVGVVGAEEQAPSFHNIKFLASALNLPSFPLTPTFPWLGPLGLIPYPTRYRIRFGDPIRLDQLDPKLSLNDRIEFMKEAVMDRVRVGLEEREHVFW